MKAGLFFGIFRALMSFISHLAGHGVLACLIIDLTTFAFSWAGVRIGERSGIWLENKAEYSAAAC